MEDRPWTRLAAHGLCVMDASVLLVRIAPSVPEPGRWTLPGGGLEWGEHPADGLRRELHEETGLDGVVGDVVGIFSATYGRSPHGPHDSVHFVSVVFDVEVTRGDLVHEARGTTDLAAWIPLADLAGLPLTALGRYGCELLGRRPGGGGG